MNQLTPKSILLSVFIFCGYGLSQAEDVFLPVNFNDQAAMEQLALTTLNKKTGKGFLKTECHFSYEEYTHLFIDLPEPIEVAELSCSRNMGPRQPWGNHSSDKVSELTSILIDKSGRFWEIGG